MQTLISVLSGGCSLMAQIPPGCAPQNLNDRAPLPPLKVLEHPQPDLAPSETCRLALPRWTPSLSIPPPARLSIGRSVSRNLSVRSTPVGAGAVAEASRPQRCDCWV